MIFLNLLVPTYIPEDASATCNLSGSFYTLGLGGSFLIIKLFL